MHPQDCSPEASTECFRNIAEDYLRNAVDTLNFQMVTPSVFYNLIEHLNKDNYVESFLLINLFLFICEKPIYIH